MTLLVISRQIESGWTKLNQNWSVKHMKKKKKGDKMFAARNKQGQVKQEKRANNSKQPPKGKKGNVQILIG